MRVFFRACGSRWAFLTSLLNSTIGLTYSLIVLGGMVRVYGAGLACPDWPLCFGRWVPPFDPLVWLEWGHRLVASVVGVLAVTIAICALAQRTYRQRLGKMALVAVVLVVTQAGLGGLTVLHALHFSTVTLHLATGLLFFLVLLCMRLRLSAAPPWCVDRSTRVAAWLGGAAVLVYAQSIVGALVSSNSAGLACPDFPTCFGAWIPPLQGLVAYQFAHRVGAVAATFIVLTAAWMLYHRSRGTTGRWVAVACCGLALSQFGLGVANVWGRLPSSVRIGHLAGATALFALLSISWYRVRHARVS